MNEGDQRGRLQSEAEVRCTLQARLSVIEQRFAEYHFSPFDQLVQFVLKSFPY
jgi:hypothetical protein